MSSSWWAFTLLFIACLFGDHSLAAAQPLVPAPPKALSTRYCQRTFSVGGETYPLDGADGTEASGLLTFLKDGPETQAAFHSLQASHRWDGLLAGLGSLGLLFLVASLFSPDHHPAALKEPLFWGGIGAIGASAFTGITLLAHRKIIVNALISSYNENHPGQALTLGLRARFFFF